MTTLHQEVIRLNHDEIDILAGLVQSFINGDIKLGTSKPLNFDLDLANIHDKLDLAHMRISSKEIDNLS